MNVPITPRMKQIVAAKGVGIALSKVGAKFRNAKRLSYYAPGTLKIKAALRAAKKAS